MKKLYHHLFSFFIFQLIKAQITRPMVPRHSKTQTRLCRDRGEFLDTYSYKISTCSECYSYLFIEHPIFNLKKQKLGPSKETLCLLNRLTHETVCPDIGNQTSIDAVCRTITGEQYACSDWSQCCQDAWKCCETQLSNKNGLNGQAQCPQTWDGWKCWDFTDRGTTGSQACPSFLKYIILELNSKVTKQCTMNATWFVDPISGLEKSDYTTCVPAEYFSLLKLYKNSIIVGLALSSLGIVLLVPSILIFICYRQLRRQLRIRIHIHLFSSLLIYGVIWIFWDVLVKYDRLVNDGTHSLVHTDQDACKFLNVLRRFARTTPFFWMLCEGFYLHTLLMKAFEPPKHLLGYYICGWGCPAFLAILYGILRKTLADDQSCWIQPPVGPKGGIEWIISAPMITCIVINFFLILNIIRIIIRQVVSHPREPKNYRRAIKATFILIPLFGIHVFFIIYLVPPDDPAFNFFQMASTIVYNSQGILISLIFCYFNGEVISLIKASYRIRRDSAFVGDSRRSLTYQSNLRRLSNTSNDIQNGGHSRRSLSVRRNSSASSLVPNGGLDSSNIRLAVICENGNGHVNAAFTEESAEIGNSEIPKPSETTAA